MSRYTSSGSESEYQPGSDDQVLLNKLGITTTETMDDVELQLLDLLYDKVIDEIAIDQTLTVADIKAWHYSWLGNVYEWAGTERSVNMSKPDIHFAASNQIPKLLDSFEDDFLSQLTPCNQLSDTELIQAITSVHLEFILIHPFREGNGRIARLIANIMALQAGFPELDFTLLDTHKEFYFKAIQAGASGDISHLKRLFGDVLRTSKERSQSEQSPT